MSRLLQPPQLTLDYILYFMSMLEVLSISCQNCNPWLILDPMMCYVLLKLGLPTKFITMRSYSQIIPFLEKTDQLEVEES